MYRLRAQILLEKGERDSAKEAFACSLEIARDQAARMPELRTRVTMAQLDGDARQIRTVTSLIEELEEGRDTPDVRAANALAAH